MSGGLNLAGSRHVGPLDLLFIHSSGRRRETVEDGLQIGAGVGVTKLDAVEQAADTLERIGFAGQEPTVGGYDARTQRLWDGATEPMEFATSS
jgi:hypothetical protein